MVVDQRTVHRNTCWPSGFPHTRRTCRARPRRCGVAPSSAGVDRTAARHRATGRHARCAAGPFRSVCLTEVAGVTALVDSIAAGPDRDPAPRSAEPEVGRATADLVRLASGGPGAGRGHPGCSPAGLFRPPGGGPRDPGPANRAATALLICYVLVVVLAAAGAVVTAVSRYRSDAAGRSRRAAATGAAARGLGDCRSTAAPAGFSSQVIVNPTLDVRMDPSTSFYV